MGISFLATIHHFKSNKHASAKMGQKPLSGHQQVDNKFMNPTKLDSPQNTLWFIFYEFPINNKS
jgi:hypothetical protein